MSIPDKATANPVPYVPEAFVQRISRRYAAGHDVSDTGRVAETSASGGA